MVLLLVPLYSVPSVVTLHSEAEVLKSSQLWEQEMIPFSLANFCEHIVDSHLQSCEFYFSAVEITCTMPILMCVNIWTGKHTQSLLIEEIKGTKLISLHVGWFGSLETFFDKKSGERQTRLNSVWDSTWSSWMLWVCHSDQTCWCLHQDANFHLLQQTYLSEPLWVSASAKLLPGLPEASLLIPLHKLWTKISWFYVASSSVWINSHCLYLMKSYQNLLASFIHFRWLVLPTQTFCQNQQYFDFSK